MTLQAEAIGLCSLSRKSVDLILSVDATIKNEHLRACAVGFHIALQQQQRQRVRV